MSENATSAVNQQGSRLAKRRIDPSETTRRSPVFKEIEAYFQGALHDASLNKQKRFRFAQKKREWLEMLSKMLKVLGYNSWIYREGKTRNVYILETLATFLDFRFNPLMLKSLDEQIAYLRGFFDAEGGIPHRLSDRLYIQLVQKNKSKLQKLKKLLISIGIYTGQIHNPSRNVDPDYWRFFILTKSQKDFIKIIGSWHPVKKEIFRQRMVI